MPAFPPRRKLPPNMKYDRKTGRPRIINKQKSLLMKRKAIKRKNRHLKPGHRLNIKRALMKTRRLKRTKFGRRARL